MRESPWARFLGLIALLCSSHCASYSKGRALAKTALQCDDLDTAFGVPARYMANRTGDLYRGCGKYALVRCMVDAHQTVCAVEEVTTEAQARQDR